MTSSAFSLPCPDGDSFFQPDSSFQIASDDEADDDNEEEEEDDGDDSITCCRRAMICQWHRRQRKKRDKLKKQIKSFKSIKQTVAMQCSLRVNSKMTCLSVQIFLPDSIVTT